MALRGHGRKSNFSLLETAKDKSFSAVLGGHAHYYKAESEADLVKVRGLGLRCGGFLDLRGSNLFKINGEIMSKSGSRAPVRPWRRRWTTSHGLRWALASC